MKIKRFLLSLDQFTKIGLDEMVGIVVFSVICTMPGRRLGTAKGGKQARPGRVLVFF